MRLVSFQQINYYKDCDALIIKTKNHKTTIITQEITRNSGDMNGNIENRKKEQQVQNQQN